MTDLRKRVADLLGAAELLTPPADLASYVAAAGGSDRPYVRSLLSALMKPDEPASAALRRLPLELLERLIAAADGEGWIGRNYVRETLLVRHGALPLRADFYRAALRNAGAKRRGIPIQLPDGPADEEVTSHPSDLAGALTMVDLAVRDGGGADRDVELGLARLQAMPTTYEYDRAMLVAKFVHHPPVAGSRWEEPVWDWLGRFWEEQNRCRRRLPVGTTTLPAVAVGVERASTPSLLGPTRMHVLTTRSGRAQWAIWPDAQSRAFGELLLRVDGTSVYAQLHAPRLVEFVCPVAGA